MHPSVNPDRGIYRNACQAVTARREGRSLADTNEDKLRHPSHDMIGIAYTIVL